jgi:small GTP-binding protein
VTSLDHDRLTGTIDALIALATPAQSEAAAQLLTRTQTRRLRVLVAGEANRGKSTLINRLLDRDVLPAGVLPLTAVATSVRIDADAHERLEVHFLDGRQAPRPLADLPDLVTEQANPDNRLHVAAVDVVLRAAALAGYQVELVDTPGTSSVFEHNTRAAREAYPSLDAVIVVLGADPPVTAAERKLLAELSDRAVRTFVVVNKMDRLDTDECDQAIRFTESICTGLGLPDPVWPMSARDRDPGMRRFQHAFTRYLDACAASDADRALRGHAARLALHMHDEAVVTMRAADLLATTGSERVALFRTHVELLTRRTAALDDLCASTRGRLLRTLRDSTAELAPTVAASATERAELAFSDVAGSGPAERAEERARGAAVALIVAAVERWRSEQADTLQRELHDLIERISADVERQLAELRQAAGELLGIQLRATAETITLDAGGGFWYATDRPIAWELPGAELARRHGPRAIQRARARVLGEIDELADRQIGRARADLQQRLTETVRVLSRQLRRNHGELLAQLQLALGTTTRLSRSDAAAASRQQAELSDRVHALDRVIAELAE